MPSKVSALLDQTLTFTDIPVVGPVTASQLRDYVAAAQPPMPSLEQVNRMLTRIANMVPSPRLSDEEAEERMATYRRTLSAHALPDLHAAFDQILRKCRFFPTIAEIEEIVAPIRAKRMARVNRALSIILKHEREWAPPIEDVVSIQDVAQVLAEGCAALAVDGEQR